MSRTQLRRLLAVAAAPMLLVEAAPAQSPPAQIPALADTTLARIQEEVTVPAGFDMTVFAAPPHLTYPTAVAPAGDGVVYVATDPNLLFGRERHLGRILRLVDSDQDGIADRYTVFADSLDSVRGLVVDGETVYAMHAPTLAAYRDTDGDGVADEREALVTGLGFGLDVINGDHTSNQLRLGLDGWIYIAVGDYGFLDATGSDGTQLYLHRGGVVRVRPDGTELEIVARGTRNIYDVALDSHLRIFSRDNNNNGQGWNSVFHHLPPGVDAGYPSRFRNFRHETHPPIADFGAGAATTTVWIEEASFPGALSRTLVSADWALNRIYRHDLEPAGATFSIAQEELMTIPRPVDIEVGPEGSLYIASLSGGSYDYAGEHVGYILRLTPRGAAAPRAVGEMSEGELLDALLGESQALRLSAQRALLARGLSVEAGRRLEEAVFDGSLSPSSRIAALFTLKQARGADAAVALQRAAEDPALRAAALRALADRRGELHNVPASPFARALNDSSAEVRLLAVHGLGRLAPANAAELLMSAATDPDPTVAHVARNLLPELGAPAADAALRALDTSSSASRAAALQVLGRMHSPAVVTALIERLAAAGEEARVEIAGTLARLHHREGFWDGEWWGNQPSTEGPYFAPVGWEQSPRIRAALRREIGAASGARLARLLQRLEREAVLPRESAALLAFRERLGAERWNALADAFLGSRTLRPEGVTALADLRSDDAEVRLAVSSMIVAPPITPAAAVPLLHRTVADESLPPQLRARALSALSGARPSLPVADVVASAATMVEALPAHPPLLQAWRRYVADRARADEVEALIEITRGEGETQRIVAFAALVQVAGQGRNPEAARQLAAERIEAGWRSTETASALARAVALVEAEESYEEELRRYRGGER